MIVQATHLPMKTVRFIVALVSLKLLCSLWAVFVFSRFSPLIDADLYLSGFFVSDPVFRTRIIQGVVLILSKFGSAVFIHWFFGVLSLAGVLYYSCRGIIRWQLCLPLLLPSTLIWSSIIGKEAIFYGAFTLALVIWTRFAVIKLKLTDYCLLVAAVVICLLLRPHYAIAILILFVSTLVIKKIKKNTWIWLFLLAIFGLSILWLFVWDPLLYRGFEGIDPGARASRFKFFGIEPATDDGFQTYKSLVPLGAIIGIVGPLPTEVYSRPILIPFFLEGVLVLLLPAVVYSYACNQSFEHKQLFKTIFWLSLVPTILALILLHAPFGLLNPGSATRWRVNFEAIFHIAPLLLLYSFLDNDRHANHPLPS